MLKILMLVLIAEFWMTVGHICFKKGANLLDANRALGREWLMQLIRVLFSSPVIFAGAVSMLVGLFFWLVALKEWDLNVVYSLGSLQYVLILFASRFFLNEKIDVMKSIGTFFVIIGIIFIVLS